MWFYSHLPNYQWLSCHLGSLYVFFFFGGGLSLFFRGNCSILSCRFRVFVGAGEYRVFPHHCLELDPSNFVFKLEDNETGQ